MSELFDDIPPAEPATPRESSVVIAVRPVAGGREVLMHKRSRHSSFLPGNWAFPGGRLEPIDQLEQDGAHARCAVRELKEETGLEVSVEQLRPLAVRTTPPFMPRRFRTQFFLVELPAGTEVAATPPAAHEADAQKFVAPQQVLSRWQSDQWRIPPVLPPLLAKLFELRDAPLAELQHELSVVNALEELTPRIEFVPGIWLVPQRAETLPPASHTNCYLAGARRFVVVDPGSDNSDELALLMETISRRKQDGDQVVAIVLTHHHRDHVAGVPVLAELLRVPVRAHPETAAMLQALDLEISTNLVNGTVLDLDGATLEVIHTPGHAPGHIALYCPERKITLCGDLVSGLSTIVIPPDGGDMTAYLRSLKSLAARSPGWLFPAHGPPLPASALSAAHLHRTEREFKIKVLWDRGERDPQRIAEQVYDAGTPLRLARVQVAAHLRRLEALGPPRRCS